MNSRADSLPAELRLGQPGEVHEAGGELGMTPMMRRSKTGDGPVDVDPSWYPGQPETSPLGMMNGEAAPAAAGAAALQAPLVLPGPAEDHVPTVLTKLQKWGDYESVGLGPVAPSRFIPMKTPLSRAILADWSLPQAPRHRLTVPELLEEQRAAGRQCGLLLDLSNHECLYGEDVPEVREWPAVQRWLGPAAIEAGGAVCLQCSCAAAGHGVWTPSVPCSVHGDPPLPHAPCAFNPLCRLAPSFVNPTPWQLLP